MREIVLDTETTGLDPFKGHKIIEIGCLEIFNKVKTGKSFHVYINPERDVPLEAYQIHGISSEFLLDKPKFHEICQQFYEFIGEAPLVIHNASFDMKFINYELSFHNVKLSNPIIDTLTIARRKYPGSPASLDALCKRFKIDSSHRTKHGALLDAELLAEVYFNMMGGNQTVLEINNSNANLVKAELQKQKIYREPRFFALSDEEKQAHEDFLKKIKNPIWN